MYQRDVRLNSAILFPLEHQHDEIGVVINEHSDEYTVGANTSIPKSMYSSVQKLTSELTIHALYRKTQSRQRNDNTHDRLGKRHYKSNRASKNPSITCKACLGLGHCVANGDICYILAKATVCHSFMAASANK